jgi:glucosylceramidase
MAIAVALVVSAATSARAGEGVQVWLTTPDRQHLLEAQAPVSFGVASPYEPQIMVDPSRRFQPMVGFGAAMTDASAQVMTRNLTPDQRTALLRELFGPDGLNLQFTRLTIGASDFSSRHYSLDDMPKGKTDPDLQHFSLAPVLDEVAPLLREARRINPRLILMASPWSAPGWMKTTDSLITGHLRPDAYPAFADYLVRYVRQMDAAGLPIRYLSLQNEPGFEPTDYPGMRVDPAERAAFIGGHLGPRLRAASPTTEILDFDHNWDEPNSPLAVLSDPVASPFVSGVAWHCYKGEVSAQGPVHQARPDKDAFLTECSGGAWAKDFGPTFDWMLGNLVIGSTRGWSRGVLLWNLALDEHYGPHLGGCGDCRGVVTINSQTGAVTRNIEYYVLGHASRFVRAGAERIASDTGAADLANVAFRNADDGSIVLIVLNSGKNTRRFTVAAEGRTFQYALPAGAAVTLIWAGSALNR